MYFAALLELPEGFSRALPSDTATAVAPKVVHVEGLLHGFLVLRSLEGEVLADGEITQVGHGDRLKTIVVFRFKDSSLCEEEVVFSQRRVFRVFSYHLTQKGPAFKNPWNFRWTARLARPQSVTRITMAKKQLRASG